MEKLNSLNLDFDRVLIQLIIPGFISIFPWIILFLNHHDNERFLAYANLSIFITLIAIISLIAGIVLENIGSRIEVHCYDKWNLKEDPEYHNIWYKFLTLNYDGKNPVGHSYLRNILLRMKFELSFACAMLPMSVGLIILDSQICIIFSCWIKVALFFLIPIFSAIYLIWVEAYSSSKVLSKTRKILVDEYYGKAK